MAACTAAALDVDGAVAALADDDAPDAPAAADEPVGADSPAATPEAPVEGGEDAAPLPVESVVGVVAVAAEVVGLVAGEELGFAVAGALEVLAALVSDEPDEPAGAVPPLEAAGVVEVLPGAGALLDVRGLDPAPAPAEPLAGGALAPLVVDAPVVGLAVAPVWAPDVVDGAEAGLPSGVAVTVDGTPVTGGGTSIAVPPSRAGARTPGNGAADSGRR